MLRAVTISCLLPALVVWGEIPATGALGVRVSVVAEANPSNSQVYTSNNKLWFISPSSETLRRTIVIQETVGSEQRIQLSIGAAKNDDGKISFDNSRSSQIGDWIRFSDNNFVLPARSQKRIEITIQPDPSLGNYQEDAFLIVGTSATRSRLEETGDDPIKVIIPVQFAYTVPLFLGIGELENLVSFRVTDINGYIDGEGKFLEASIENDGSSIIEPTGRVQLKLADFSSTPLGPFQFKATQFRPRTSGVLVARVPENVLAANYEAFVEVQFGSFVDAKIFTKYLDFQPKRSFNLLDYLFIVVGILVLALSVWGWKRRELGFRSDAGGKPGTNDNIDQPRDVKKVELSKFLAEKRFWKRPGVDLDPLELDDEEISKLMAEILEQATTKKKATTKKAK